MNSLGVGAFNDQNEMMSSTTRVICFAVAWSFLVCLGRAEEFAGYSTSGREKAQGVSVSLDHPSAWVGKDSPQAGVVHEFRDPATGGRDALLIVVPTSQPRNATAKDFRASFELPDAQERIMPGAHHRHKEFIDGLEFPCVALDYDLEIPQLAPAVVQVRNYILLVGEKMLQIQFYGVAPPSEDIRIGRAEMMDHIIRSVKSTAK